MNATTTAKTTTTATKCLCGCGNPTANTYRPGHDARHVSILLNLVTQGLASVAGAHEELPSIALRNKFDNALANLLNKAEEKAKKAELKALRRAEKAAAKKAPKTELVEITEVKVGRWWYPIVQITDEVIVYTKRDKTEGTTRPDAEVR